MITTGGAHLVESSDRVEEPNCVMRSILFIPFEIWVARSRIEHDVGIRLARRNYSFLETDLLAVSGPVGPVISVVTQRQNRLCRIDLAHAIGEVLLVPTLRRH